MKVLYVEGRLRLTEPSWGSEVFGYVNKLREPLYQNSLYMILASLGSSGFGFVFWMMAAGIYPQDEVGVATVILSSAFFIVSITRFGLDQSIIRFFPSGDKSAIFGSSLIVTTVLSIAFGLVFVAGLDLWSPGLGVLRDNILLYIALIVLLSAISTTANSFTALRRSSLYFHQTLITGLRVPLLFMFVGLGAVGIFMSMELAIGLAVLFSLVALYLLGVRPTRLNRQFLKESANFSMGNYVGGLLINAPTSLLPIMVLNTLGAADAANYYMAYAIVSILVVVPAATSTSLFVEVSNGEALARSVKRALSSTLLILLPFVAAAILLGGVFLDLLGKEYAEGGLALLQVMSLSAFFMSIYTIFQSVQRVKMDMRGLIVWGGVSSILLLVLSQVMMEMFGLVGIGAAWVLSYGIVAALLSPSLYRVIKRGRSDNALP